MKIENCVALVTGANRGLGRAIAEALLRAGAAKVYAAARDPASVNLPGAIPVQLDVTDAASVRAAAGQCPDVTLLVNNAGIALGSGFLGEQAEDRARQEMDTNFFGPLATSRAFAPALAVGGGGAIVNVLSVLSWLNVPGQATYGASKAAAWALTNGLRGELESQNTQVVGVHVGYMDTDMTDGIDVPKTRPEDVAAQILAALEAGEDEVLADALSRQVKDSLSAQPGVYLRPPAG